MSVLEKFKQKLQGALADAVERSGLIEREQMPDILLEIPKEKQHGDFSTNLAMR